MIAARFQHWRTFARFSPPFFCALSGLLLASVAYLSSPPAKYDHTPTATSAKRASIVPTWSDSDSDGLPDSVEVRSFVDRENFRRWFTGIAETQFYQLSREWNAEQQDCAGLVRFAVREALRAHDRAWFQKMGAFYEPLAADVRAYKLGDAPLGEKIFRNRPGAFKATDLDKGRFSEFADARTLRDFNCVFVSRDRRQAQPGDLLFFERRGARKFPDHVMIFIGTARDSSEVANDWVVYHTGATPTDKGTVKKVRLAVLDRHPDARWRPVEMNPNFLGFYRLKMLD